MTNNHKSSQAFLARQRYGKDKVRVVKVFKENHPWQEIVEYTICVLLEGDFEESYTEADNSKVVATDSMKNMVYVLAKTSKNVRVPEAFGQDIAAHLLQTYGHISHAHITLRQHRWTRMLVEGEEHPHSFQRDGEEVRLAWVTGVRGTGGGPVRMEVAGGIEELLVLKTTGSAFTGFLRDRFTTLPEMEDRIFSTLVSAKWRYATGATGVDYSAVHAAVRETTLRVFATDASASVQATLYRMGVELIGRFAVLADISYALPNKHVFTVDLSPFGLANTGANASVYMPVDHPSGLISATVERKVKSKM